MISEVSTDSQVLNEIHSSTDHEDDFIAVLATVSPVLKADRPHDTWVSLCLSGGNVYEMILSPYQGSPNM